MNKNPIEELSILYKNRKIEKYNYINQMHVFNKNLFYIAERIKNTDIQKIEIQDDLLLFTTRRDNLKFAFNGLDRRGAPFDILNFDSYEKEDEQMILRFLKEGDLILDIGANIGWYSILFSKKFPQATIYSFEPIHETYKYLITNLMLNKANNVFPLNIGISEKDSFSTYYYFPEGSVLASERNLIECSKAKKTTCKVTSLDTFINEQNINKIDFIKCDIEGAELSAITGGIHAIKRFLPIMLIELFERWTLQFGYHPNDVIHLLNQLGYECFLANKNQLENCPIYKETEDERLNFFFLHKEKHRELIVQLSELSSQSC